MTTPQALRVVIVDDEPLARLRLQRLLGAMPMVQIVASCADGVQLAQVLTTAPVELILLDIEMPELDGFAALTRLPPPRPRVIFVTAYAEFALRAFEFEALDYLLKPIDETRLKHSLARAFQVVKHSAVQARIYAPRIALPIGRRMQLIESDSIDLIVAQANYLEIRAGQRDFVVRRSLASFTEELDPQKFLRVHRSTLVRIAAVVEVQAIASGRHELRLHDGRKLFAARNYRQQVRDAFGLLVCMAASDDGI